MDTTPEEPKLYEFNRTIDPSEVSLRSSFNFFDNPQNSGPKTVTQTARLRNVGQITGVATEEESKYKVLFEVDTVPQATQKEPNEPITGIATQGLILTVELPNSKQNYASLGRVEKEPDITRIIFDKWQEHSDIKRSSDLNRRLKERIGQPLTIEKTELQKAIFLFSTRTQ